jgi:hypothetical protein
MRYVNNPSVIFAFYFALLLPGKERTPNVKMIHAGTHKALTEKRARAVRCPAFWSLAHNGAN